MLLVLFSGTITASALGHNSFVDIARWSDSQFWFERENISATNELIVTLKDYGIEEKLVPTWLPSEYKLASLNVFESDYQTIFNAIYKRITDDKK